MRERERERERESDREREREREREGGRESDKKQTCQAHIMIQNVQDAAWNETSHPKSVHVYLLSHQTIPAIQSNKDIHNTQSNHILSIKKSKHVLVWKLLLQMFAHLGAFSRPVW